MQGFRDLIDVGPCKAYETLKDENNFGGVNTIQAVMSPFKSNSFYPEDSLSGLPFIGNADRLRDTRF